MPPINSYLSEGRVVKQKQLGPFTDGAYESIEPHLLKPTELQSATNVLFDSITGRVTKRPGAVRLPFDMFPTLESAVTNAYVFYINGVHTLFVTDGKYIAYTSDMLNFVRVQKYDATDLVLSTTGAVQFIQSFDKLWVTNKIDAVVHINSSFEAVIHDQQKTGFINNSIPVSTITTSGLATNEFKNKVVAVGLRSDGTLATNTGLIRRVVSNTATVLTLDSTIPAGVGADSSVAWFAGIDIPRAGSIAFKDERIFVANTENNLNEIRFSSTFDLNRPVVEIESDHPLAWPADNQLLLTPGNGDRIWGFTPVYRNRLAVMKDFGLYRIENDPTFTYVIDTISSEAGSRFPQSWIEKDNVLFFLGSRNDNKPDIFRTDFVTIKDFNRKHSDTLDSVVQGSQLFRSSIFSEAGQWSNTNFSTTNKILSDGSIGVKEFTEQADLDNFLPDATANSGGQYSNLKVDAKSRPGKITIQGIPDWDVRYNALVLPDLDAQPWVENSNDATKSFDVDGFTLSVGSPGWISYTKDFTNNGNKYFHLRIKGSCHFGLWNGSYGIWFTSQFFKLSRYGDIFNQDVASVVHDTFIDYHLLLKEDGSYKLWKDGTLVDSGTAKNGTTRNRAEFGVGYGYTANVVDFNPTATSLPAGCSFKYVMYHEGLQIDPADTIDKQGAFGILIDYKFAMSLNPSLYSFGKYHFDTTLNSGTAVFESKSSAVFDGLFHIFSQTSFPGSIAFSSGAVPASSLARYLAIKVSLSSLLVSEPYRESPTINGYIGGSLEITKPILIGDNISQWLNFYITHTTPGGGSFSSKIRRSTQDSIPSELDNTGWDLALAGADAEGWVTVNNGDSLATVLTEPGPIFSTRWVQIKQFMDVASYVSPPGNFTTFMEVDWLEGSSSAILSTVAVNHKKRYLLSVASSSSDENNLIVMVDKNNAFGNWTGIVPNFMVWFKGDLFFFTEVAGPNLAIFRFDDNVLYDQDSSGNTVAINAAISTKQEGFDSLHTRKKATWLEIQVSLDTDSSLNVSYLIDDASGTAFPTLLFSSPSPVVLATNKRLFFPMGTQFRRMSLTIINNSIGQDFGLELLVLGAEHLPSRSGL